MGIIVNQNQDNISDFINKSEIRPTLAYQLGTRAEALRLANLHKEAVGRYLNAILMDRTNPKYYYGLGVCYKNLSKTDKAIEAFEQAKKYRSFDFNIHYELGVCNLLQGNVCDAMINLKDSLRLKPDNLNAQIQLAIAHELIDEKDFALMIYQKIIETNKGYIKAYHHKSALLMELGEYFEAGLVFNQILKLNPNFYKAYLGLGICFDKLSKYSPAVRYYKKFLSLKPFSDKTEFVNERLNTLKLNIGKRSLESNFKLV